MDRSKRKRKPSLRAAQSLSTKRESKRVSERTSINLGGAFERWRQLRDLMGFKSDPQLAFFLLDRVCGEPLSQDNSSETPRKRGKRQKSTSALKSEVTRSNSPQPSPDPQSTDVEVRGIGYDVPPLWLYQPVSAHTSASCVTRLCHNCIGLQCSTLLQSLNSNCLTLNSNFVVSL